MRGESASSAGLLIALIRCWNQSGGKHTNIHSLNVKGTLELDPY